ncbi:MAG: GIY-YIG nuclease family protein [Candidatus Omnitrophica bacterium]|nr:GIY-YIG nuclease family protein [Candidatus Omnitrophota bacterium]
MPKIPCVYIMTNISNSVLYTGVTSALVRRVYEHKNHLVEGFTDRYNLDKLAWYEIYHNMASAIAREKQIKGWARHKKLALIKASNPEWKDLYDDIT